MNTGNKKAQDDSDESSKDSSSSDESSSSQSSNDSAVSHTSASESDASNDDHPTPVVSEIVELAVQMQAVLCQDDSNVCSRDRVSQLNAALDTMHIRDYRVSIPCPDSVYVTELWMMNDDDEEKRTGQLGVFLEDNTKSESVPYVVCKVGYTADSYEGRSKAGRTFLFDRCSLVVSLKRSVHESCVTEHDVEGLVRASLGWRLKKFELPDGCGSSGTECILLDQRVLRFLKKYGSEYDTYSVRQLVGRHNELLDVCICQPGFKKTFSSNKKLMLKIIHEAAGTSSSSDLIGVELHLLTSSKTPLNETSACRACKRRTKKESETKRKLDLSGAY